MAFWTDGLAPEPKRQFRFKVNFPGMPDGGTWYARSATKPTFAVSQSEHKFLNHTFYYPGKVTWNTVTISFADPANPDATAGLLRMFAASGYRVPDGGVFDQYDLQTLGKENSTNALGQVHIEGLNAKGAVIEQWILNNAFVVGFTLNDYSYEGEDLSTVDCELRFDWASFDNDIISSSANNKFRLWTAGGETRVPLGSNPANARGYSGEE